jgi:hypothetical protein
MPQVRCDIHGGGIRNWAKVYDQEEWPRPTTVVDLATIRPIAVMTPSLLGLDDVYNSVRATVRFDDIQVQKAIPVNQGTETPAPAPDGTTPPVPVAVPVGDQTAAAPTAEPEVRKAEAVTPLDSPVDAPAIQAPTPEPINF